MGGVLYWLEVFVLYILVSGSRSILDKNWVFGVLEVCCNKFDRVVVVGGGCSVGVDSFLKDFCDYWGCGYVEMKAKWNVFGKRAGFVRNKEMVDFVKEKGGVCVCLWDKKSRGCKNVIDLWGSDCWLFTK